LLYADSRVVVAGKKSPPPTKQLAFEFRYKMAFLARRVVILALGGSGALFLVQKLLKRTSPDSKHPSPLELVAKGASQLQDNVGAFSLHDTLLALTAMSKVW
jgi:hypothetical protein